MVIAATRVGRADRMGRAGAARLASQYWRANTAGSERYVLTPAGAVRHRLAADESGVDHLVLAGDWTRNGIDGGCVEAVILAAGEGSRLGRSSKPLAEVAGLTLLERTVASVRAAGITRWRDTSIGALHPA